jgi:hypothetical protein
MIGWIADNPDRSCVQTVWSAALPQVGEADAVVGGEQDSETGLRLWLFDDDLRADDERLVLRLGHGESDLDLKLVTDGADSYVFRGRVVECPRNCRNECRNSFC